MADRFEDAADFDARASRKREIERAIFDRRRAAVNVLATPEAFRAHLRDVSAQDLAAWLRAVAEFGPKHYETMIAAEYACRGLRLPEGEESAD